MLQWMKILITPISSTHKMKFLLTFYIYIFIAIEDSKKRKTNIKKLHGYY